MPTDPLQNELDLAIEIAKKAGGMITENYTETPVMNWKSDHTPLTKTDTAINSYVIKTINQHFPEHNILGEEEDGKNEEKSDYIWVCDPIDGTIPYSHGALTCAFSLALVYKGAPIVAVVNSPFEKRIFTATKNQETKINGKPSKVNSNQGLENSVVNVEVPHDQLNIMRDLRLQGAQTPTYCSFIWGALRLISGHFNAAIYGYGHPWDCAAIKLLVEQAGGKTSNYKGEEQRYDQELNGFVASNLLIHEKVLELIVKND